MGVNVSQESKTSRRRHLDIENRIRKDEERRMTNYRILLLGAGDSGKSTIVKQMRILRMGGFTEQELINQRTMVIENILQSIATMIRAMKNLSLEFEIASNKIASELILKVEGIWLSETKIGHAEWSCIKSLWSDAGIQACFRRSNEYQLIDSAKYFLDQIDRISQPNYVPTFDDILRVKVATQGIVELTFPLREGTLTIIDVGGQRSQRKKWIHCFEGVHSLIFIAALNEYNQVLYENDCTNRLTEALQLFHSITSCCWFKKSPILLFLNKKDLFAEKLPLFPLSETFPEYIGPPDFDQACRFIQTLFEKRNSADLNAFYVHKTCATDTKNVEFVMGAAFDIILAKTLKFVLL